MDRLKAPLASEPTKSIALARLFVRAPIGAPHGMAIAADRRSPTTGIRRWLCEKREIETSNHSLRKILLQSIAAGR
jgi:hypothetical protein